MRFVERLLGRGTQRAHELFCAVADADKEQIQKIIRSGGDVDSPDPESACTPLGHAAHLGLDEIVDLLLRAGADPNKRSYDRPDLRRCTPLMEAAYSGHVTVVRTLLAAGADVHAKDASGDTAMSQMAAAIAIRNRYSLSAAAHYEVVRLLRAAGARGGPADPLDGVPDEHRRQVESLLEELNQLAEETRHLDSGGSSFFFDPRDPDVPNASVVAIGESLYRLDGRRVRVMGIVADAIGSLHGSHAREDLSAHWNRIGEAEFQTGDGEMWMH